MNKIFTKIGTAMVGIAMAVGVGVALGSKNNVLKAEAAPAGAITSYSDLSNGDYYIGTTQSTDDYYLKLAATTAGNQAGTGDTQANATTFSVTRSNTTVTLKVGNLYVNSCSTNGSLNLSTTECSWTASNEDGLIRLTSSASKRLAKHTSMNKFGSYASGTDIWFLSAGYRVTYDSNGATSGTVPTDSTAYQSGTTVTVKANSGSLSKTGYTFGGWNTLANGTGTNYEAGTGQFTITGHTTLYAKWNAKEVDSISLSGTQKTVFWQNEAFDSTGLVVTANYSGGAGSEEVTPESISSPEMSTPGNKIVTVSFGGKSATYNIYVVENLNSIAGQVSSQEEEYDTTDQGYENAQTIASYSGTYFSVSFSKGTGSNDPKYYDNNVDVPAIRVYANGTFTISSENSITRIVLTFGSGDTDSTLSVGSVGSYNSSTGTWTGSANSITFTNTGSGQRRIASITVTCNAATHYEQKNITAQKALMVFVDEFNLRLGTTGTAGASSENKICKTDGTTNLSDLANAWSGATVGDVKSLKTLFEEARASLESVPANQAAFDNMVKYATAKADGDSFQKALSLYNHLVVNRGLNDFLTQSGRGAASISSGYIVHNLPSETNSITAIIIVIAAVSTLVAGGFFFIRKKKNVK